ncbi:MAG: hypothetical protein ACTHQE_04520 [Thermomicrobiales bacterium]
MASLAGGVTAVFALHRAARAGENHLLLTLLGLLAGIAIIAAMRTWEATLTVDGARLVLPLPLDPASRWRAAVLDAALASSLPSLAIVIATLLTVGWQWAAVVMLWLPVAWNAGTGLACAVSWSLTGGTILWRTLALILTATTAIGSSTYLFVTAPRPLPTLMFLPDALILGGLAFGPGAPFVGRAMIPIAQQVAIAPPRTFAAFPRLTNWIASRLERHPIPALAIVRKDLLAQSRDAFTLLRIVPIAGVLPLMLLLRSRLGKQEADASWIAVVSIALAYYGMLEIRPSPLGGEGNRILLALQAPIRASALLGGKTLGMLAIEIPQVWLAVTIAVIGTRDTFLAWGYAIATASITVVGLATMLTAASVWDIDLERRVDDRTQAVLVEHVPFGARRMLGLGLTGVFAGVSAAILLRLPMPAAGFALIGLHATGTGAMALLAVRRLTALCR